MKLPIVSKEYQNLVHIYDPIFMENVYFFRSTNHKDFEKRMRAVFKGINLEEYFPEIARNGKTHGGFLEVENKEKLTVFCLWCERKIDGLVHEVYHLVYKMLNTRRIMDDETGAYLMGFFIKEITKYFRFK